jgi:Cu-processing system ATP-binding protein
MPTIATTNVRKTYGDVTALDGVSLSVDRGETFGLVGTNGAGKTTLFRLLVGHETPDAGAVRVAGRPPDGGVEHREEVGFLPENAGFEPALTGREVLGYYARLRGVPAGDRDHRVRRVLATVGLVDAADRPVRGYSNGMYRRLGLATTLLTRPSVLLLDEPTAGLDPEGVAEFHDVVRRVADSAVTVVVSSHDLREVATLCDRAAVLHGGRKLTEGPVDELRAAADDRPTVRVRVPGTADRDAAHAAVAGVGGATLERAGESVVATCPRGSEGALLDALRDHLPVGGFEVRGPDLADGFRATVAAAGDEDETRDAVTDWNGGETA